MIEIQIFNEITTYFFIDVKKCPAENQDMYSNDIDQEVVSSWDECGEYLAKSNFLERGCKL